MYDRDISLEESEFSLGTSPWLNHDPKCEISLSYIDRLMVDFFSHFSKVFRQNLFNFLLFGFTLFPSS